MDETQRNELGESACVLLNLAQQKQMPHPVFRTFRMAVHHRAGGGDAQSMRRADNFDPLAHLEFIRAQFAPHLVVEDFRRRSGNAAQTGFLQHQQVIVQRHSRFFRAVDDLHG